MPWLIAQNLFRKGPLIGVGKLLNNVDLEGGKASCYNGTDCLLLVFISEGYKTS